MTAELEIRILIIDDIHECHSKSFKEGLDVLRDH